MARGHLPQPSQTALWWFGVPLASTWHRIDVLITDITGVTKYKKKPMQDWVVETTTKLDNLTKRASTTELSIHLSSNLTPECSYNGLDCDYQVTTWITQMNIDRGLMIELILNMSVAFEPVPGWRKTNTSFKDDIVVFCKTGETMAILNGPDCETETVELPSAALPDMKSESSSLSYVRSSGISDINIDTIDKIPLPNLVPVINGLDSTDKDHTMNSQRPYNFFDIVTLRPVGTSKSSFINTEEKPLFDRQTILALPTIMYPRLHQILIEEMIVISTHMQEYRRHDQYMRHVLSLHFGNEAKVKNAFLHTNRQWRALQKEEKRKSEKDAQNKDFKELKRSILHTEGIHGTFVTKGEKNLHDGKPNKQLNFETICHYCNYETLCDNCEEFCCISTHKCLLNDHFITRNETTNSYLCHSEGCTDRPGKSTLGKKSAPGFDTAFTSILGSLCMTGNSKTLLLISMLLFLGSASGAEIKQHHQKNLTFDDNWSEWQPCIGIHLDYYSTAVWLKSFVHLEWISGEPTELLNTCDEEDNDISDPLPFCKVWKTSCISCEHEEDGEIYFPQTGKLISRLETKFGKLTRYMELPRAYLAGITQNGVLFLFIEFTQVVFLLSVFVILLPLLLSRRQTRLKSENDCKPRFSKTRTLFLVVSTSTLIIAIIKIKFASDENKTDLPSALLLPMGFGPALCVVFHSLASLGKSSVSKTGFTSSKPEYNCFIIFDENNNDTYWKDVAIRNNSPPQLQCKRVKFGYEDYTPRPQIEDQQYKYTAALTDVMTKEKAPVTSDYMTNTGSSESYNNTNKNILVIILFFIIGICLQYPRILACTTNVTITHRAEAEYGVINCEEYVAEPGKSNIIDVCNQDLPNITDIDDLKEDCTNGVDANNVEDDDVAGETDLDDNLHVQGSEENILAEAEVLLHEENDCAESNENDEEMEMCNNGNDTEFIQNDMSDQADNGYGTEDIQNDMSDSEENEEDCASDSDDDNKDENNKDIVGIEDLINAENDTNAVNIMDDLSAVTGSFDVNDDVREEDVEGSGNVTTVKSIKDDVNKPIEEGAADNESKNTIARRKAYVWSSLKAACLETENKEGDGVRWRKISSGYIHCAVVIHVGKVLRQIGDDFNELGEKNNPRKKYIPRMPSWKTIDRHYPAPNLESRIFTGKSYKRWSHCFNIKQRRPESISERSLMGWNQVESKQPEKAVTQRASVDSGQAEYDARTNSFSLAGVHRIDGRPVHFCSEFIQKFNKKKCENKIDIKTEIMKAPENANIDFDETAFDCVGVSVKKNNTREMYPSRNTFIHENLVIDPFPSMNTVVDDINIDYEKDEAYSQMSSNVQPITDDGVPEIESRRKTYDLHVVDSMDDIGVIDPYGTAVETEKCRLPIDDKLGVCTKLDNAVIDPSCTNIETYYLPKCKLDINCSDKPLTVRTKGQDYTDMVTDYFKQNSHLFEPNSNATRAADGHRSLVDTCMKEAENLREHLCRKSKDNLSDKPTDDINDFSPIGNMAEIRSLLPVPYIDMNYLKSVQVYRIEEPLLSVIDRLASPTPPTPHVTMRYEILRLCTLRTYPKGDKPYLIKLAAAGFYYASDGDGVVCYCCGSRRYNWTGSEDPMKIHQGIKPNCKFLTKNVDVNVPVVSYGPLSKSLMALESIPEPNIIRQEGEIEAANWEYAPERPRSQQETPAEQQTLGINNATPKHPNYTTKTQRLNSYKEWPKSVKLKPEVLVDSGFFYAGFGDCVRCFFCGIGLRHWSDEDDPWIEHARWARTCVFVRQKKGEEFVNLVQLAVQLTQEGASAGAATGNTNVPVSAVEKLLLSKAALNTVEMGCKTDHIHRAIEEMVLDSSIDNDAITPEALVEKVLEIQGRDERAAKKLASSEEVTTTTSTEDRNNTATSGSSSESREPTLTITNAATGVSKTEEKTGADKTTNKTAAAEGNDADSLQDPAAIKHENEVLKEQTLCKVCLDNTVCIVFLPCGHLVTCADCAPAMRKCPICRALVKGTVRTYMS